MDFSVSDLNFNSDESQPSFEARAAFTVNSATVFREDVDILPPCLPIDGNLNLIFLKERDKHLFTSLNGISAP